MNFQHFAEQHGLIIDSLITDRWVRVPTIDKPQSKNGAYFFDGQTGAVQNWAIHTKPVSWRSKEPYKPDPLAEERKRKAAKERAEAQEKAKRRAIYIVNNAKEMTHPYLASKGFPKDKGYVWNGLLVVPMRVEGRLVGCQLIQEDGTKRFLSGQRTKGVSLLIDNKGMDILCEGYATALSVRRAMKFLRLRYRIHVCFSAGNMVEIAKSVRDPLVIADHDPVGIRTAKSIGRYWVSDTEGEDFNDMEQRTGVEVVARSLLTAIGHSEADQ